MKKNPEVILQPVRANPSLEARFRRRLLCLIEEMNNSFVYWLEAQFKETPPEIAMDATPAHQLQRAMNELKKRWRKRFNETADSLAEYYATEIADRSDARLKSILRKSGFSVQFRMTRAQKDIIAATVHENVSLIKSIPMKYMTDVEGDVMRAVQVGGDLGALSKSLQKNYEVTKKRAHTIARDQNNKATAALTRSRQMELGIKEAIWVHSGGGKHPRPSHVKAGAKRARYDVMKGWYDPAVQEYILPGTLINCRCTSRPIIKGFI